MFKKKISYIAIIAIINGLLLALLIVLWTDKFELLFNEGVRFNEGLKIVGFTILSIIGMKALSYFFRKRNINQLKIKVIAASLLTFLISFYLYTGYAAKIINNRFLEAPIRKSIISKAKPVAQLYGTEAKGLTLTEYRLIRKGYGFQDISAMAFNIDYVFDHDDFFGDYYLSISYSLPKNIKVDTFRVEHGQFYKGQNVVDSGNWNRVQYYESQG